METYYKRLPYICIHFKSILSQVRCKTKAAKLLALSQSQTSHKKLKTGMHMKVASRFLVVITLTSLIFWSLCLFLVRLKNAYPYSIKQVTCSSFCSNLQRQLSMLPTTCLHVIGLHRKSVLLLN